MKQDLIYLGVLLLIGVVVGLPFAVLLSWLGVPPLGGLLAGALIGLLILKVVPRPKVRS